MGSECSSVAAAQRASVRSVLGKSPTSRRRRPQGESAVQLTIGLFMEGLVVVVVVELSMGRLVAVRISLRARSRVISVADGSLQAKFAVGCIETGEMEIWLIISFDNSLPVTGSELPRRSRYA